MNHSSPEDPLDDYRRGVRRARLRSLGLAAAFLVGLPGGAVFGFVVNRALFGDYGGSSLLVFVISGAAIGASLMIGGSRAMLPRGGSFG